MDQNALRSWLDFYDQQFPRGGGGMNTDSMFETGAASAQRRAGDARNNAAGRMLWAERMMQQQDAAPPDFFGGGGGMMRREPQYVRPREFTMERPEPREFQAPLQGDIDNYVARILRGGARRGFSGGVRG